MSKKKQIIFSSLLGIVLLVVIFMPKKETTEPLDEIEVTDSLEVKEITYKYGIPIDDYDVDYGIVKRNQSLSTILQKHGLSVGEVHRLVEKSKDVFDVRKIRSDQAYAVFTTRDSIPETCYFVYEIDPKSYVVFDLRGDYRVTMGEIRSNGAGMSCMVLLSLLCGWPCRNTMPIRNWPSYYRIFSGGPSTFSVFKNRMSSA